MFGLYIHIPFCKQICSYCDFYKMRAKDTEKAKYISYLMKEIALLDKDELVKVETIYIGGGTPSSLPLVNLRQLLEYLSTIIDLNNLREFTIELNPEDITMELASLLREFHLSRLSIGIQSFNPLAQKIMHRNSNFEDFQKKINILHQFGFDNISLDLIYGIPGTTKKDVIEDLELFLSLEPVHLSCYSLILEEKTLLYHRYLKGEFYPINEDLEIEMFQEIKLFLSSRGYHQYEMSNFARPGYESLHNLIYWSNGRYRGLGAGSSSYLGNRRFKTVPNLNHYFIGLDQGKVVLAEDTELTVYDQMSDEVMLGLRLTKGIDLNSFYQRYQQKLEDVFPNVSPFVAQGVLLIHNHHLTIAPDQQYLTNYILRKIL